MRFTINTIPDKAKVIAYIEKLTEGKKYSVSITQKREVRTLPQNKLYWLWIACISDETGNDKNTLHDFFRENYLGTEVVEVFGQEIKRLKSTTGLNTKQFTHYLDMIQAFVASELGIVLPNPEDIYFNDFYERYKNYN